MVRHGEITTNQRRVTNHRWHRKVAGCAIALMGAATVTGAAWADDQNDIVVAVTQLTAHLDPMGANANVNERISENVVENLIRFDFETAEMKPGLATSWRMVDDVTMELQIREGVTCHNGEEFNAEDVAYMFGPARYNGEDAPGFALAKQFLGTIESVDAVDSHRVRIKTKLPDALLVNRLAGWMGQVPCADAYKDAASWEAWGQAVVGTGPYKIAEVRAGEFQRFEAFDGYWGEKAPAASFTLKVVPEMAARVAGLISGDFDFISEITPDQFKTIEKAGFEIAGGATRNVRMIPFDTRHSALRDPRVRRAMSLAIDRDLLVETLFGGRTEVPNGLQMKSFGAMHIDDFKGAKYDPETARKLLEQAGYDGEEISYRYRQDYYTGEVASSQALQQMWKDVGLNVKLELVENTQQVVGEGTDDGRGTFNWSVTAYLFDPLGQIYRQYGPDSRFQKEGYWYNERFNIYGEELYGTDPEMRRNAARGLLEIFETDPPATYLHVNVFFYAKKPSIVWKATDTAFMDFRAGNLSFTK